MTTQLKEFSSQAQTRSIPHAPDVAVDLVDRSTRQAAELLFPKGRGLALLADLLQDAAIEQQISNESERITMAVVRLASVEQFARRQAQSKDTILRYLTVLEALQILIRRRTSEATEIRIPLVPWSPDETAMAGLDTLLQTDAARDKLQQLAAGVKERFLLLYGSPQAKVSLFDELISALSDIQELLQKRVSATKRQLLQVRIDTLMIRLKGSAEKGDFHAGRSPFQTPSPGIHSNQASEKGDLRDHPEGFNASSSAQKGDFQGQRAEGWASDSTEKGDFSSSPLPFRLSFSTEKGDFSQQTGGNKRPHPTQKGDFQNPFASDLTQKGDFEGQSDRMRAEKGDFEGQSDRMRAEKGDFQTAAPGASLNDNDTIYSSNNSRSNDDIDIDAPAARAGEQTQEGDLDRYTPREAASVGKVLALFLEKSPRNTGGFVNKCKQYPRTVIRAAVIDMLVHSAFPQVDPADERGRPRNRASWFHDACHKYGKPGTPLPAYVKRWLRSDDSFSEIEEQLNVAALRYKRCMAEGGQATGLVRLWLAGQIEQQELEDALQVESQGNGSVPGEGTFVEMEPGEQSAAGMKAVPRAEKGWMDEGDAEALVQEIMGDRRARALGISATSARDQGVFVVHISIPGVQGKPFVMATPQEWRKYLHDVQQLVPFE